MAHPALTGNVYEWVAEPYAPYETAARDAGAEDRGVGSLRVARGGCFLTEEGHANTDRTTFALAFDWGCVGFRCCNDLQRAPDRGGIGARAREVKGND